MAKFKDVEEWDPDLDGAEERHPLIDYDDDIAIEDLPQKTVFTVTAESHGRAWESSWLIPKDISETDWLEIQRMLKLAMTTLCRLPMDQAIGVVDPEGYKKMMEAKAEREQKEREKLSAVPGEELYEFKEDE